jgi:hypothetical protein
MIRLRFVRAKRMIVNEHWPFHHAERVFFDPIPQALLPAVETLLHHVQPGQTRILSKI